MQWRMCRDKLALATSSLVLIGAQVVWLAPQSAPQKQGAPGTARGQSPPQTRAAAGLASCKGHAVAGPGWRAKVADARLVPSFTSGSLLALQAPDDSSLLVISFDVASGANAALKSLEAISVRAKDGAAPLTARNIVNRAAGLESIPESARQAGFYLSAGVQEFSLTGTGAVPKKGSGTRLAYVVAVDRNQSSLVVDFPKQKTSCDLEAILADTATKPE
jgi:hypothetical protein